MDIRVVDYKTVLREIAPAKEHRHAVSFNKLRNTLSKRSLLSGGSGMEPPLALRIKSEPVVRDGKLTVDLRDNIFRPFQKVVRILQYLACND